MITNRDKRSLLTVVCLGLLTVSFIPHQRQDRRPRIVDRMTIFSNYGKLGKFHLERSDSAKFISR